MMLYDWIEGLWAKQQKCSADSVKFLCGNSIYSASWTKTLDMRDQTGAATFIASGPDNIVPKRPAGSFSSCRPGQRPHQEAR